MLPSMAEDLFRTVLAQRGRRPKVRFCFKTWNGLYILEFQNTTPNLRALRLVEKDMDADIDHYLVLGLPSGEEGSKLTEKEITIAYRLKALELHLDKRPEDPNVRIPSLKA